MHILKVNLFLLFTTNVKKYFLSQISVVEGVSRLSNANMFRFPICTPLSFHTKINDPTILMDNSLLDYATLDENFIYIYICCKKIIVLPQC
jgi:hypothetical protein